jgi:hypothetical protein
VTVDTAAQPRVSAKALSTLVVCLVLMFVSLTWAFLSMRAVMAVGGACADGGPYVSAQPCPDGAVLIAFAIPVMIITAMVGSVVAIAQNAPNLLIPMWAVLFGSLGWNFLEFAFGAADGIVWGWLFCGIVFWAMALPAVVLVFTGIRDILRPPAEATSPPGSPWWLPAYSLMGSAGVLLGWWSFHALS